MQPAGPLSKGGPAFFLPSVVGTFITGIAAVLSAVAMLWHGGPNPGSSAERQVCGFVPDPQSGPRAVRITPVCRWEYGLIGSNSPWNSRIRF